jgi:flagellar assembly factor FliW
MKYETTRFGRIEVTEEEIITMPSGPLGFPDCTRFIFVDEDRAVPFRIFQSLDNPALAFVVCDPLIFRPDYLFEVTFDDLRYLDTDTTDGLHCYCIVSMAKSIHEVTVNLQGPLVINTKDKIGHQFVICNSEYTTRERLLNSAAKAVKVGLG